MGRTILVDLTQNEIAEIKAMLGNKPMEQMERWEVNLYAKLVSAETELAEMEANAKEIFSGVMDQINAICEDYKTRKLNTKH